MVSGLRSFSAIFDTVVLENRLVDLDQQEAKLKEEMRLRLARILEDRARVQQMLDAARDFANPFQTLSGVLRAFVESVEPSLRAVPGLGPMVEGLQRILPRPVAQRSHERETEPSQEPPGGTGACSCATRWFSRGAMPLSFYRGPGRLELPCRYGGERLRRPLYIG